MMLIPRISRRFWVKENDVGIYLECIGNALYAFSRWPWLLDPWRQSMDTITWPQQNLEGIDAETGSVGHQKSWSIMRSTYIYIIYYITHIQYIIYTHNITYESSLDEALWNKSWAKLIQQNLPFFQLSERVSGILCWTLAHRRHRDLLHLSRQSIDCICSPSMPEQLHPMSGTDIAQILYGTSHHFSRTNCSALSP
jgi:hypothetical protein